MQMRYRLIDNGNVISEQIKDFDGDVAMNKERIQSDIYDEMDPLQLVRSGQRITWVDARVVPDAA